MSDNNHTPLKRCSKCKTQYPATTEFFRKASKAKSGLTSACKPCLLKLDADYRLRNPECGKAWYEAHKDELNSQRREEYWSDPERFRQIGRDYYKEHPEPIKRRVKKYQRNNPDKVKAIHDKQYADKRNDPDLWREELERSRLYRKQFPERRRLTVRKSDEKHIDKRHHYANTYHLRFPEKARAKTQKRLAMKQAAEGSYTADDLKRLYEEQDGMCAYCGQRIFWTIKRDIHIDHIQPLSKGGSNNPDNLALTCHACNESKADLLLPDWLASRGW